MVIHIIHYFALGAVEVILFVHCSEMFPPVFFDCSHRNSKVRIGVPFGKKLFFIVKQDSFFKQPVSDRHFGFRTHVVAEFYGEYAMLREVAVLLEILEIPIDDFSILSLQMRNNERQIRRLGIKEICRLARTVADPLKQNF